MTTTTAVAKQQAAVLIMHMPVTTHAGAVSTKCKSPTLSSRLPCQRTRYGNTSLVTLLKHNLQALVTTSFSVTCR
jgi:hypothetical protein